MECYSRRFQSPGVTWELPTKEYISKWPEFVGIVGAAIIIHNNRVLLIQRASSDEHPSLWEVPGGGANDDETAIQCAIREVREEVGLVVSRLEKMIGEFEWKHDGRTWKIFMFLAIVGELQEDNKISLDPREHQAFLWATESEVRRGSCDGNTLEWISINQREAILAAFELNKLNSH